MKISVILPALFVLFACNNQQTAEPEVKESPAMEQQTDTKLHIPKEQLASEIDLVCQMSVAESQADTMHYGGKIYGFCGPGCKAAFAEDPASYLK